MYPDCPLGLLDSLAVTLRARGKKRKREKRAEGVGRPGDLLGWAALAQKFRNNGRASRRGTMLLPSPLSSLCSHQKHQLLLVSVPNSLNGSWWPRDEEDVGPLSSEYSKSNQKSRAHEKINKNLRQQHNDVDEIKGKRRADPATEEEVIEFGVY